ncbi:MAG: VPLPA-CTERM-specific exosortase XrtD [Gammaproteobacteria bacterium]|nr:VPLPA-CTERM-specific exosortase XrtD [Gammaproteobacteria bacterium]
MKTVVNEQAVVWKESISIWVLWVAILALSIFFFYDSLAYMVNLWEGQEEYGHGFLIPVLTAFFIWQQKDKLEKIEFQGSWKGLAIVVPGLFLYFVGELATLYVLIQYAFVVVIIGLAYCYTGSKGFRYIGIPLLILFFMIPLPNFLYQGLSAQLQLISTQIGVAVIRLMDISVFVEGNVIDLGTYKLQVVEACSGLRYLFPLMALGFIAAYIFKQAFWKKAVIFLSTIPITILMNSFRIGVIGILVEYWGQGMAEGFLHDFEGWVVFMGCMGILILEMLLLVKIGSDKTTLVDAFGLEFPEPAPGDANVQYRKVPRPFMASIIVIVLIASVTFAIPEKVEIEPARKQFVEFPVELDAWKGRAGILEQVYIDALKFTDYAMYDYAREGDEGAVNFYSAYYASQKKGASAHSPRSCIPGGGWRIASHTIHSIPNVSIGNNQLNVNRLVIQKDEYKQLVYYWFQQRGRIITNEYLMKWYLFWDSITKNRTDGALIRFTTLLKPGQDISIADERLETFSKQIALILPEYVAN